MIIYKILEHVNQQSPIDSRKYHTSNQNQGDVTLRQIAKRISRGSTISMMDTLAVLIEFLYIISHMLLDHKIVKLTEFGTFRATISSEGVETAKEFSITKTKRMKTLFIPSNEFRDRLNNVKFSKVNDN